jgi:hypothetical protein
MIRREILAAPYPTFRRYQASDANAIAAHYNKNLTIPDNIWCAVNGPVSPSQIKLHRLALRAKGSILDQVHEDEKGFLSYFIGTKKNDTASFSMGVVNLDHQNPMDLLRQDAAKFIDTLLKMGINRLRITGSSDKGKYVDWMENEVKMVRAGNRNLWTANRESLLSYKRSV